MAGAIFPYLRKLIHTPWGWLGIKVPDQNPSPFVSLKPMTSRSFPRVNVPLLEHPVLLWDTIPAVLLFAASFFLSPHWQRPRRWRPHSPGRWPPSGLRSLLMLQPLWLFIRPPVLLRVQLQHNVLVLCHATEVCWPLSDCSRICRLQSLFSCFLAVWMDFLFDRMVTSLGSHWNYPSLITFVRSHFIAPLLCT